MEPMELGDELHAQIARLSDEGNALCDQEDFAGAFERFELAYGLLPPPKDQWEASQWLLAALGDCRFGQRRYQEAHGYFARAASEGADSDGPGNPFIWLRRGQCLYETGADRRQVLDALISAYMLAGASIFEHDDPKYYAFLTADAALDPGDPPA
jgi:tetratricopeptide (TPR) repeat protein